MSYSCLEELQVDLDLHTLNKTVILSKAGRQCNTGWLNTGWLIVTNDGNCHLFDKDGNLDDIKKVTYLNENYIRRDIAKIIIPNSVIDIEKYTFLDCIALTSVMISGNVKSIRHDVFAGCHRLTSVKIPNSVISIEDFAFYECRKLTNMTIGNSITNIGRLAFFACNSLTNLTFKGKTLEQVKKMDGYPWGIKDESIINVE